MKAGGGHHGSPENIKLSRAYSRKNLDRHTHSERVECEPGGGFTPSENQGYGAKSPKTNEMFHVPNINCSCNGFLSFFKFLL